MKNKPEKEHEEAESREFSISALQFLALYSDRKKLSFSHSIPQISTCLCLKKITWEERRERKNSACNNLFASLRVCVCVCDGSKVRLDYRVWSLRGRHRGVADQGQLVT